MTDANKQAALDYHAKPIPGKLSVELTKPTATARDLALAYSPGVAEPVREIARDPENAYRYTGKGNLVAVISDGTAILGLGNLGPLASKPVMEGKSVLFKRFAGINSVDIQVNAESPQAFIDTVARIADTWGGINLEDIKAPECFDIEQALIEQCSIPVFHDDQHGTAIVTAAGMLNALEIAGKRLEDAKIVCLGAGAAAIACMKLLVACGARAEHLLMLDRRGVIHTGREGLTPHKAMRSEEHTSELQSRGHLVCRLLLEKKKVGGDNYFALTESRICQRGHHTVARSLLGSSGADCSEYGLETYQPLLAEYDVDGRDSHQR